MSAAVSGEIIAGQIHIKPQRPPDLFNMQYALRDTLEPINVAQGEPTGEWIIIRDPEMILSSARGKGLYTPELAGWQAEAVKDLPRKCALNNSTRMGS